MKRKPKQYEYEPDEPQDMTVGSYSSGGKTGKPTIKQIGFTANHKKTVKRQMPRGKGK